MSASIPGPSSSWCPAGTGCPSCLSYSLLRRRLASSLIKLAIHLMWCRSKHSAILAYIRAIAILFFSLASTPSAGVESREKNRAAMARIYGEIAECLDRHIMRCMAILIRELARRRRRREQERQLGHAMPTGHHMLDEENDDGGAEVAVLPLQGNVWVVKNTAGGLFLRVCWVIQFNICALWFEMHFEVVYPMLLILFFFFLSRR